MAFLPFWRTGGAAQAHTQSLDMFTHPLNTDVFIEIVCALHIDETMVGPGTASFDATPQISNNMVNWEDVGPAFTQVAPGSTFPITESVRITDVGKYMRYKLTIADGAPISGLMGLTFSILGDGKVTEDEELEGDYSLFDTAMLQPPLYVASPAVPPMRPSIPGAAGGLLDLAPIIPGASSGGQPKSKTGGGPSMLPGAGTQPPPLRPTVYAPWLPPSITIGARTYGVGAKW